MTQDEKRKLIQAMCLMNVRGWVDAGVTRFEGRFADVRVPKLPGPESDIAATVWVEIHRALDSIELTAMVVPSSAAGR